MNNIFTYIYNHLASHKRIMWFTLISIFLSMLFFATKIELKEDIMSFFPKSASKHDISQIFSNLKSKNRLIVMFTADSTDMQYETIDAAIEFCNSLKNNDKFIANANITSGTADFSASEMSQFVYDYLPIFLDDSIYNKLDSITNEAQIKQKIHDNYNNLISPIGSYISEFIYTDPLSLAGETLSKFQKLGGNINYNIIDDHIFLSNNKTLICYIDIDPKCSNVGEIIDIVEDKLANSNNKHNKILADYFGAPAVAEYNARVIKTDSMIAVNTAILLVVIVIMLIFRSIRNVLLLLTPITFGTLFALCFIYFIQGSISIIALGAGSIVIGVALSYAIHTIVHSKYCDNAQSLISELAVPLTIGSFTTIGAFVGLTFTNSAILHDLGIFASLMLIGTTLFTLIYLPHFIKFESKNIKNNNKILSLLSRLSNSNIDKNKPIIYTIIIIAIISAIFFNDVKFDSNMMNLNYNPPHLAKAEKRLNELIKLENSIVFVSTSNSTNDAITSYNKLCEKLNKLENEGVIESYSDINHFVISDSIQEHRLNKWKTFWSKSRIEKTKTFIEKEANKIGFNNGAYDRFFALIEKDYKKLYLQNSYPSLLNEWVVFSNDIATINAHAKIKTQNKNKLYNTLCEDENIIALDQSFFAGEMAKDVKNNFLLILSISSILIFLALLLSYGRLELSILAFLPMFISWIIILGIMSILGIEFNIVTIILSTFIFGIGDDFSIFVMEGLQTEYKYRKPTLNKHKTAIILSSFALIFSMGILIFTRHPAMHSLGTLSFIGMLVVVLVSFTIQPYLFKLLITKYAHRGDFPYTFLGIINTAYSFSLFIFGCITIQIFIAILFLLPIKKHTRKYAVHSLMSYYLKIFMNIQPTVRLKKINDAKISFDKPAIIISNHQSFIDILVMLGMQPKAVMFVKSWVWNSPFFGPIVRYLDFFHTSDGYQNCVDALKEKVDRGYSIIIFPEGSRSNDNKIKRFHKGAFYLAEQLQLDIIPIVQYGNGHISSKNQGLYIKKGFAISKILNRITINDKRFGNNYSERTRNIGKYFREEFNKIYEEYNRSNNPYFRDALIKNYIFKGPSLEWYMKVKLRMENYYETYDRLLPRKGTIVDLGCGYGAMSYMMLMLSEDRKITAIDYDREKIDLANNCFSKNENINFEVADIRTFQIPKADAYVISDVLHYIDPNAQLKVIQTCIDRLSENGILLIRDGDKNNKERHINTVKTELWSTKIIKFNKTDGELYFLSKNQIIEIANKNNLNFEAIECDKKTSNTLFILRKTKKQNH